MRSPFSPGSGAYQHELYSPAAGEEAQDDRPLNERSLETGDAVLFCSTVKEPLRDEAGRRFINYLLQTCRTPQPDAASRRICAHPFRGFKACRRSGITARWILAGSLRCLTCVRRLSSAPFNSRNWWNFAGAIQYPFERWHIRAEIRIDAFDSFNSQPRPPADIWLQQLYARYPVPAFLEWLASTTLFTRFLPEAQRRNLNALLPTILEQQR